MIQIPENIRQIANYKPGKPADDMFAGLDVSRTAILCSNENNFGCSPMARQAIVDALDRLYLYPDPTGDTLKNKICAKYGYQKDQIILGNGSDGILYTLFKAFFNRGEHLLTSDATFVSLKAMAMMNDVPYRTVPMKEGYAFDLDALLDAIDDQTKVIYICNPNNPTGAMIPQEALQAFLEAVPERCLVIVDEAYYEFSRALSDSYPDSTRMGLDNVLTLRTFSKSYGLAGIRLGFGIAAPEIIQVMQKVKLTFNPSMLAQAAGVAALDDEAFLGMTIGNNSGELQRFYDCFETLGISYVLSYANFVMIDLQDEDTVEQVYEELRRKGVLVRRLGSFGLPHCIRVSVGRPEENTYFFSCFREVCQSVLIAS